MRGEHGLTLILNCWPAGSSPRARGAPVQLGVDGVVLGIIPACARSTSCRTARPAAPWDHPRVRGEHVTLYEIAVGKPGSSPRARGAPAPIDHHRPPGGIIPACAGSTADALAEDLPQRGSSPRARGAHGGRHVVLGGRDHTRVRGEHGDLYGRAVGAAGSSPRARGALRGDREQGGMVGIIPACAGSTPGRRLGVCGRWDHPRVRGEHTEATIVCGRSEGSSPRARGARSSRRLLALVTGIIPACAGSTPRPPLRPRSQGDHPRVRGEHRRVTSPAGEVPGSSPRARGAHRADRRACRRDGIIPACAGSTRSVASCCLTSGDHPRVRGEHSHLGCASTSPGGSSPRARGAPDEEYAATLKAGSSPRARGALRRARAGRFERGIIPACAGST